MEEIDFDSWGSEAADATAEQQAQADAIVDGIYFDLPDVIYHRVRRLSTSALQKIDVSPADWWAVSWLNPNPVVLTEAQLKAKEAALRIGRAYHCARLEPEKFERQYVRALDKADFPQDGFLSSDEKVKAELKRREVQQTVTGETMVERAQRLIDAGHEGVIWCIEVAKWETTVNGREPLDAKVYDEILIDMDRLQKSKAIAALLSGGQAEVSVFWTDEHGLKMKARIDYLKPDLWDDFKTFSNPRRKKVRQVLADAFRFDRHHMQAVVYRDAVEQIRNGKLQVIGEANDDQRALIAAIQMRPTELACHYIYQQKGGVPNLFDRRVEFFEEQFEGVEQHPEKAAAAAANGIPGRRTQLHIRGRQDVEHAKAEFNLYAQTFMPGEPWAPIEAEGTFGDVDFNRYWLEGIE